MKHMLSLYPGGNIFFTGFVIQSLSQVQLSKGNSSAMLTLRSCVKAMHRNLLYNWVSEASPTLGCSIEISRDIYIYVVGMSRMSK